MTMTIDASYNKALNTAQAEHLACEQDALNPLKWHVASSTDATVKYTVILRDDGSMEGATCNCKGGSHPACKHRASSMLAMLDWFQTKEGLDWFSRRLLCAECGERTGKAPAHANTELCQFCIDDRDLFGAA